MVYRRVSGIFGAISVSCLANEPVEWLYGTSSGEVKLDYYITPLRGSQTFVVEEGGAVGPFQAWQRVTTGYGTKPAIPVTKAKVFAVNRGTLRQESHYITVNSKSSDNEKCFSEDPKKPEVPEYNLDDLNELCQSKKLNIVKPSDTIKAGEYSGARSDGPELNTTIDDRGSLITAKLTKESSSSRILYMSLGESFIHAKVGLKHFILRNSNVKDPHVQGTIGRSNLHEWDSAYKIKFRRRKAGSIAPGKVSGNEADVEDNIED